MVYLIHTPPVGRSNDGTMHQRGDSRESILARYYPTDSPSARPSLLLLIIRAKRVSNLHLGLAIRLGSHEKKTVCVRVFD